MDWLHHGSVSALIITTLASLKNYTCITGLFLLLSLWDEAGTEGILCAGALPVHPEQLFQKCHTSLGSEMTGTRRNRYKALRICPDALFCTVLRQRREETVHKPAAIGRIIGFFQKIAGRRRKKYEKTM